MKNKIIKEKLKKNQKLLALWAADCAEHVLLYFEKEYPNDDRPRKAIEACREWAHTEMFKMADVRKAALSAHAAAREVKENNADATCFAARAAGQAMATAHVPQHAFGAAYYALKVVEAANSANAKVKIIKELNWQSQRLPKNLRQEWQDWQYQHLPKHLLLLMKKSKISKT